MTPIERERAKRAAQARLAAMRERAARLRRRVLVLAAIGFAVVWVAIFAQMATGHDPALGPLAATVRNAGQESVASDPERRVLRIAAPREEADEEGWGEAPSLEEQAEAEAIELEAATTGQS